jgi:hypothetical protein
MKVFTLIVFIYLILPELVLSRALFGDSGEDFDGEEASADLDDVMKVIGTVFPKKLDSRLG